MLSLFLIIASWITLCHASAAQPLTFFWGFGGNLAPSSLTECQRLPIQIIPNAANGNSTGTPPYYMMSIGIDGITRYDSVGSDPANLSYTVNHAAGTSLILSMTDSLGSSGGIPQNLFTVVAGSNSCIPPPPSPSFLVSALSPNVNSIETCSPWSITVSGGVKPYNVTLVVPNYVPTNITFGPGDDTLMFVNRAQPGHNLYAIVSDANGQYALGTPSVKTTGSTDVRCPGLNTQSGSRSMILSLQQDMLAQQVAKRKQHTAVIAVVVIILLILLIGVGLFGYLRWKKRRSAQGIIDGQDALPRKYDPESGLAVGIERTIEVSGPIFYTSRPVSSSSSLNSSTALLPCPPGCTCDLHRMSKAQEAATGPRRHATMTAPRSAPLHPPTTAMRSMSAQAFANGAGSRRIAPARRTDEPESSFIQHRDGGGVQELPPPYLDRSNARNSPPPVPEKS